MSRLLSNIVHDNVIRWKYFPRYWPFVRGIQRSPVNSPHKGQWCWALMFSLICLWINGCVNSREAGDLRRHRAQYDVTVMFFGGWNAIYMLHNIFILRYGHSHVKAMFAYGLVPIWMFLFVGYWWVIASQIKVWVQLLIHVRIPVQPYQ